MRYAVFMLYAGGGLLNVMTTTLTTIMMSTLVLLLIIMLITATLHNATKMPYRASAAQIPMIVTVSNLLNVLTVPLSNAAVRWMALIMFTLYTAYPTPHLLRCCCWSARTPPASCPVSSDSSKVYSRQRSHRGQGLGAIHPPLPPQWLGTK